MVGDTIPMHRCGQYMRWNGSHWYCTCNVQAEGFMKVRFINAGPMKPRPISEEPDTDEETEIDNAPPIC